MQRFRGGLVFQVHSEEAVGCERGACSVTHLVLLGGELREGLIALGAEGIAHVLEPLHRHRGNAVVHTLEHSACRQTRVSTNHTPASVGISRMLLATQPLTPHRGSIDQPPACPWPAAKGLPRDTPQGYPGGTLRPSLSRPSTPPTSPTPLPLSRPDKRTKVTLPPPPYTRRPRAATAPHTLPQQQGPPQEQVASVRPPPLKSLPSDQPPYLHSFR